MISVKVTDAPAQTNPSFIHAAKCKKPLDDCKTCAATMAILKALSLPTLSRLLEEPLALRANFRLSTIVADNLVERTTHNSHYNVTTKSWSQKPRTAADSAAGLNLLKHYHQNITGQLVHV